MLISDAPISELPISAAEEAEAADTTETKKLLPLLGVG